jgi:hypothetical protein
MLKYDTTTVHSFSNTPDKRITLFTNSTHIAVGFCDFRMLCTAKLVSKTKTKGKNENENNNNNNSGNGKSKGKPLPLKFVGVDMSAFTVAKFHVINQMFKDSAIEIESILEVWYSATWTRPTMKHFKKALTENVFHSIEIDGRFVNIWQYQTQKSLKDTLRIVLLEDIRKLRRMVSANQVQIELIHAHLTPSDKKLIEKLH